VVGADGTVVWHDSHGPGRHRSSESEAGGTGSASALARLRSQAKAGLVAMTRTIARQYGHQGVTAFADEFGVEAAAQTGLGEVAHPQDVANVVAFLSSGLAKHATGTTIDVNGASYVR
jgi:NAD(P)-dependent dehydrogenase (short-subunit alcohol dehydrogenase family)